MFRSPPRARASSRWIVLLTVVGVWLALPAVALAGPVVTIADQVSGRDPLTLGLERLGGGAVTVTAVDAAGSTASWTLTQPGQNAALDLLTPDAGAPPVNGPLTVTVALAGVTLAQQQVRLDASPPTPSLSASSDPGQARLEWAPVTANGPVTYTVERTGGGGVWQTLASGTTATSLVDRGLSTDWYRYRLTASIPAAGAGHNTAAVDVVLRVAAPEPQPSPEATGDGTPEDDAAEQPRTRRGQPVAAAGGIRGGVSSERPRTRDRDRRAEPTRGVAYVPSVADRFEQWQQPVPSPTVAAARMPADPTWTPHEHLSRFAQPVTIPPPGTLAIDAVRAANDTPQGVLAGVLALVAAGGMTVLVSGRLRRWLTGREAPPVAE